MSIKLIDDLTLDIFVKKEILNNVDLKEKQNVENYLKKLFKTLKNKYNIIIEGYYNINIYIDKYYGILLHFEKEDIDYYDYFKNQVDMKIKIENVEFLYLVDDIPIDLSDKIKIVYRDNNIYIKLENDLDKLSMMKLMEYSKVIY